MWRRPSTFRSATLAIALGLTASCAPARAWAQACCAGGSAVTPGRLELHEKFLVGAQLKAADGLGSYAPDGRFVAPGPGDSEQDFEQDLIGAVRFLRHAQAALLVPLVELRRSDRTDGARFGGGVGDVNASARYDFVVAGESLYVPGIALLVGVTFPTGKPPEEATPPLSVDATGTGAFQVNAALAIEQTFGSWLVNATGIVAARTPRYGQTLGTQVTLLAAGAYTFPNDMAVALSASYAFEGDATTQGGADVPGSSKRLTTVTLSGLWPFAESWRLLGGVFVEPPVSWVGSNQPSSSGLTLTVLRSWS
jgi:hypothetical protein